MKSNATNEDCMDLMKRYPSQYFDIAIVDPVYGELVARGGYMTGSGTGVARPRNYNHELWKQEKTRKSYFDELFRVSKNQIIWGGNYFVEEINKNSSCWIVWNKDNTGRYADCELAWTSFKTATRMFTFRWNGMLQENMKNKEVRIHPTQKPVALYAWLLKNYAKEGDKILDTHLGSGSSRIACDKLGFDFTACELDASYFESQENRWKIYKSQLRLF